VIRGARLDRNPLRRATDRIETCLLVGLFAVLGAVTPFIVRGASDVSYASALHSRHEQQATRHQVRAVLTADAPQVSGYTLNTGVLTPASWASVTGVHRWGSVPAVPGSSRGTVVTVWTDDATGNLDSPPLTMAEAAGQADAAMVGSVAGAGLAYVVGAGLAVHLLNRRRIAAWEADWLATAPAWNRQRW